MSNQDERLCRVDSDAADIVRVSLKGGDTLQCVVVEHAEPQESLILSIPMLHNKGAFVFSTGLIERYP